MKYRIRKKGAKYVIERKPIDSRWQSRTLLPTENLWKYVCPDINTPNVSEAKGKENSEKGEKFGQGLLNEGLDTKEKGTQITKEQSKILYDLTK